MRRPSYEILAELIKRVSARDFAYRMRVHLSLAYKWANHPDEESTADTARQNPIDRTEDILRLAVVNGHHDIAIEIMDGLAREFGGAYVSGKTVQAIKKVAEFASGQLSETERANIRKVTESGKSTKNIAHCIHCGERYILPDLWCPLSEFCNACHELIRNALGARYLRKRA